MPLDTRPGKARRSAGSLQGSLVIPNPWDGGSGEDDGRARLQGAGDHQRRVRRHPRTRRFVTLDETAAHVALLERGHRPSRLRRPRARLRLAARGRGDGDRARRGCRRGRGLDRGLGPGRRGHVRARARRRADRRGTGGCGQARLHIHAHWKSRESLPEQPRPRRHDPPPPGLRGRRRCALRAVARGHRQIVAVRLQATEKARQRPRTPRLLLARRDLRGRRPSGSASAASSPGWR